MRSMFLNSIISPLAKTTPHYSAKTSSSAPDGRRVFSGRRVGFPGKRAVKPDLGIRPVAGGGVPRDPHGIGRFSHCEARVEAQLDQLGLGRVFLGQSRQGIFQVKNT